jgi:hypothetical protein
VAEPLSSSPHLLEANAADHADAPTTRTSSPALIDDANTQQNEIASAGPVETGPRDEVPTFERQRRERLGMGIAIAAGIGVAIVLVLVVSSIFSGTPDPSPAASSWAPPPAPPDPVTIPAADPSAAAAAPGDSAHAAASASASPHGGAPVARPRHTGGKPADCAQPFIIDSKGVRIPKMHCL